MSAGNAGTSNNSGGRDTKTPFGTASSTKTKDKFGYTKPKNKTVEFIKGGLVPGFVEALKKGRESDARKRKEYAENEKLKGTPDYQGGLELPPTITEVLAEQAAQKQRDGENNSIKKVIKPELEEGDGTSTDQPPTTSETDTETEANRLLKIKKKGRSKSIMTSSKGVTKTSSDYSLGKSSLLGRV